MAKPQQNKIKKIIKFRKNRSAQKIKSNFKFHSVIFILKALINFW